MADAGDELRVVLFVVDTGPLITLAAADSLDYLTLPNVPVFIPDGVFYEATVKYGALGAQDIISWAQDRRVALLPTAVFAEAQRLMSSGPEGPVRLKGLGERAAMEVITDRMARSEPAERAVLVAEDGGALARAQLTDQTIPLHMSQFLTLLEQEGRINSADEVYRRAEDAGRYTARRAAEWADHERGVSAVRKALTRPGEP